MAKEQKFEALENSHNKSNVINCNSQYSTLQKNKILNKKLMSITLAASMSVISTSVAAFEVFSFQQSQYEYNESEGVAPVTINMTSDYGGPCELSVEMNSVITESNNEAFNGEDFNIQDPLVVSFMIGPDDLNVSQTINIPLVDDRQPEDTELIFLRLENPQVVSGNCSGNINQQLSTTSIDLYDNPASTNGINLLGLPGDTVQTTFTINPVTAVSLLTLNDPESSVTPDTVNFPEGEVTVTYTYNIPDSAVVGTVISDAIRIDVAALVAGAVSANNVQPTATYSEIPVSINIGSGVGGKPLAIGDAWQQFCEDIVGQEVPNQDLLNACLNTDDGNGNYTLSAQQQLDLLPEEMAAMATGAINIAQGQIKSIFYQQQARRKGMKGMDLDRLTLNYRGQTIPAGQILGGLIEQATGGAAGDENKGGRWSGFVSGRVNAGDKQATDIDSGYDYDTVGLTAGADYMFSDQFFLGGALGYAAMASDFGNNGGDLDISSTSLIAYGSYFTPNNLYADFSLIYGTNGYDFNRNLASFNTQTNGDTDGDQFSLSLSGGMDFYRNSLMMSPYLRLDYIDTSIDAYEESGGAGLALQVDAQDVSSLTTALGGRFNYTFNMSWGVLVPAFSLEWIHEYKDDEREIIARFKEAPSQSFATPVDETDTDYLNIGLGINATFPEGRVLFMNFDTVAEQQYFNDYTLHLGGRMEF